MNGSGQKRILTEWSHNTRSYLPHLSIHLTQSQERIRQIADTEQGTLGGMAPTIISALSQSLDDPIRRSHLLVQHNHCSRKPPSFHFISLLVAPPAPHSLHAYRPKHNNPCIFSLLYSFRFGASIHECVQYLVDPPLMLPPEMVLYVTSQSWSWLPGTVQLFTIKSEKLQSKKEQPEIVRSDLEYLDNV